MIEHATWTAVLANLEMQIFKNFVTPHGQPVALRVKLYRVVVWRKRTKISWHLCLGSFYNKLTLQKRFLYWNKIIQKINQLLRKIRSLW